MLDCFMVASNDKKMIISCSPMMGICFDGIIVASTEKE